MTRTNSHWFAWGRALFAGAVVVVLVTLGLANIALYPRWHDVEDGVLWNTRTEGLTAIEVAPGSAAAAAGIERGDVLLAVNGEAVQTRAEITDVHHRSQAGSHLSYSLLRLGTRQALQISLAPAPRGGSM
jgi:S1-C subfamily serine protease